MLIPFGNIYTVLNGININITGILHIGAHNCEEFQHYINEGIDPLKIIWIDALPEKVQEARLRGIPNVYNAVISDKEEEITFHITNNEHAINNRESSSILEFDTHTTEHPHVKLIEKRIMNTIPLTKFFKDNNLEPSIYNFWNIDIQGVELYALKGAGELLKTVSVLYLEVNTKHLYKNCPLLDEIDSFLSENKFVRVALEMTSHGWGDALYIKHTV
jgi:FkbM family methyltransferase